MAHGNICMKTNRLTAHASMLMMEVLHIIPYFVIRIFKNVGVLHIFYKGISPKLM